VSRPTAVGCGRLAELYLPRRRKIPRTAITEAEAESFLWVEQSQAVMVALNGEWSGGGQLTNQAMLVPLAPMWQCRLCGGRACRVKARQPPCQQSLEASRRRGVLIHCSFKTWCDYNTAGIRCLGSAMDFSTIGPCLGFFRTRQSLTWMQYVDGPELLRKIQLHEAP